MTRPRTDATYILPWPPSVNGYWRSVNGRQILSKRARQYRVAASEALLEHIRQPMIEGPIVVTERFYPPTKREYDLDNFRKAYRDAMTHFGIWGDDRQIVQDHGRKCEVDKHNPRVEIEIQKVEPSP